MDIGHFITLARYNRWANERLYAACATAGEEEITRLRPSAFGSILATLNHILVGDRAWIGRIEGGDGGITALDQILYKDFVDLRAAHAAFDDHILAVVSGLSGDFDRPLEYHTVTTGTRMLTPLVWVLTHLFNHQTHHRGQIHGMLSQTAVPPPSLDLIYFIREQ